MAVVPVLEERHTVWMRVGSSFVLVSQICVSGMLHIVAEFRIVGQSGKRYVTPMYLAGL